MKRWWILGLAAIVAAIVVFLIVKRDRGPRSTDGVASTSKEQRDRDRARVDRGEERPRGGELDLLVDDDREGTLRLEGIVLDSKEQPVAGATVTVNTNPPRTTTSGEDGTFAFDKLVGRRYRLVAIADQGVAGPVVARLNETSDPVTLRLSPAASVEVTVIDAADRRPIAGATVELRDLATIVGTSDAEGKVTFTHVIAGRHSVVAWARGYGKTFRDLGVARATSGNPVVERTTLELRRGAGVSGVVKTRDGKPVEGARVAFDGVSDWFARADARRDAVKTDADGAFRFDAIVAGTFRFTARHEDFAPGSSAQVTLDGVSEKSGVEIVLDAGGTLAGTVVGANGDPVGWAAVRVATSAGFSLDEARQTLADERGRFEMKGVPRKKLQVVAVHETATSETIDVDLVSAPDKRDLVLVLELDGVIAGIVVDSRGEPVPEAQISAVPDLRGRRGERQSVRFEWRLRGLAQERADAGGRWEIRGLRDGDYQIRASRPGKSQRGFLREGTPASVGDTDVKVVLEAEGRVVGKVLMTDGEPPEMFVAGFGGFGGGGTPFATDDGSFELDDVPPGERSLTVSGPSFDRVTIPVVVEADRETDVGTIQVSRGRTISGRVLTPSGAPVSGATVVAARRLFGDGSSTLSEGGLGPRGGGVKRATSDEDGAFVLYGVGARELAITAEHETHGRSTLVTIPGSTQPVTIDLVVQPFSSLQGVVRRGGAPVEDVPVNVTSQRVPTSNFLVQTGPDGAFRFDRLAPDTYIVSATEGSSPLMGGFRFHTAVVTLDPGETETVDLAIPEHTASLVVTPVAKGGESLRIVEIRTVPGPITAKTAGALEQQAAAIGAGDSGWQVSLGGMPVEVDNLAPGRYSVCAVPYPSQLQGGPAAIFAYREREGDNLPVFCVSQDVTTAAQQPVTIEVEVPPFVPDPEEAQQPVRRPAGRG